MSKKKKHISLNTQSLTLYLGIFMIILTSYVIISTSYEKINRLKDKINRIESIKFNLYELNFDINNNETSRIAIKSELEIIESQFNKLIDKESEIYNPLLTDSTKTENLRIQLSEEDQKIYLIYRNWRTFSYHVEKTFLAFNSLSSTQQKDEDIMKIQDEITFIRQFISKKLFEIRESYTEQYNDQKQKFNVYFVLITLVNLAYVLFMYSYTKRVFTSPLNSIIKSAKKLSNYSESINFKSFNNLEFNVISKVLQKIWKEQKDATEEIKKITSGDISIDDLENHDKTHQTPLFDAINQMKSSLLDLRSEEEKRKWIVQGQAQINEILSKNTSNLESLTKELTTKLVKYTKSSQGGLFIVKRDKDLNPIHLELVTSYAYERFNNDKKIIQKGEGILGQVWLENKGVYIDNIPEEHMSIKSFVGKTQPNSILIEPLTDNNEFYGVIELASLNNFKEHEIELIQRIATNIASTLATVENNNRTQKLLEESQSMTEKLQKQEELMKSNLEKLTATQEEIKRREIQKENELKAFTEQFNEDLGKYQRTISEKEEEIINLQNEISLVSTDNDAIRNLRSEIEDLKLSHQKEIADLQETIKIKEMRVLKFKKKLDKLTENE